jgi:hypothetical protein
MSSILGWRDMMLMIASTGEGAVKELRAESRDDVDDVEVERRKEDRMCEKEKEVWRRGNDGECILVLCGWGAVERLW